MRVRVYIYPCIFVMDEHGCFVLNEYREVSCVYAHAYPHAGARRHVYDSASVSESTDTGSRIAFICLHI